MKNSIKVIFMGTPEFSVPVLESLKNSKEIELSLVVTQPDAPRGRKLKLMPSPVKERALQWGLSVVSPDKISEEKNFALLKEINPDVIVVLAYGQLLKQNLLDLFPNKFINIHASLLPRWRGAAPIQRALMEGDKETGISYQIMKLKLDSGPLIFEEKINIKEHVDSIALAEQLSKLAAQSVEKVITDFVERKLTVKEQVESLATYAKKIEKTESAINWSLDAKTLHNQIRGLQWGPGAYTFVKEKRVKLSQTVYTLEGAEKPSEPPGKVIGLKDNALWFTCGRGLLGAKRIQPQGKPPMEAGSFVNGYMNSKK